VRDLWNKNLIQLNRLTALEREATRVSGERAQLVASTAAARGRVAEIELQIIQIDNELISEVSKDMRDVDAKIGEFVERRISAEDLLKRVDLRAPQDGMVHQLAVHTVGGVVTPGDPVMLIVPLAENLVVEIKVNPQDIDQLHLGQPAALRFTAFNQHTTPEIDGFVSRISADVLTDQRSGANYYTVRIAVRPAEISRLGSVQLVPGMPVEAFVKTIDRSVMSYLVKPLADQMVRAFREK
jgi:HlyD family secretion protein